MTEPTRLLDGEDDDFVRDLLRSADDDVPDPAVRARTLAQLAGRTASIGSGGDPSATASTNLFGLTAWKWLALFVMSSVVIAVLALRPKDEARPTPPSAAQTSTAAASIAPPSEAETTPAPATTTAPTGSTSTPPAASIAPVTKPTTSMPVVAPAREVGLAEETKMLDEARAALAKGDARAALVVLDRYDREAKQRILGPEATMVRIEALHARGDDAGARALARRFLGANPGSAYEDRVRSLIGEVPRP